MKEKYPAPWNNITFMHNIGHTIRLDGEILEDNPAVPNRIVPMTSDNYSTYHRELFNLALETLSD